MMRLRALATAGLALAAWSAIAAALPFVTPSGRSLAVIGPASAGIEAVAASGGQLLRAGRLIVVARSDDPDFVRRLYAAGAILVLDAEDAGGCSGRGVATRL
jgi:hypothetical protein